MPQLRIELFGHVRILDGGEPVVSLASSRRRALLAYLALNRHGSVDRKHLAYLFWPDSEDAQARTNLRRELHHLRSELPRVDDIVELGSEALRWKPGGPATSDVAEFEDALEEAAAAREQGERRRERRALERAAQRYRGDLLPSCYDDWIEPERQRLRSELVTALNRLVEICEGDDDAARGLGHVERLIRIDPLDERAYRSLMRLHQRAGNRAAAIHAFHRCAGVLQRELDVAPSPETHRAYEALLEAEGGRAPPPTARETRQAAPLVGREAALATLEEAWRRARAGELGAVVVFGEAGIGKTRLIDEFVRRCLQQGASVISSRAYAAEGTLSYGLAVDWLRCPAVAERAAELPAAWLTEVARLVPELQDPRDVAREPPDTVPASWQRRRLLEGVAHAVLAAPAPTLLVVDDLQWADADSLDAMRVLTRLQEDAALLIVATIRSEELPGKASLEKLLLALRAEGRLRDLELRRLGRDETALLARQVATDELLEEDVDRLYRISEGVPLFVVETLRAEVAHGSDAHDDDLEALPPRVRAILAARLRQLSPQAKDLAELAATIGRAFHFETLRLASDLAEEALVRSLDELWRRRIVLEQAAGAYDFSHDALRDAAYLGADPARKRLLHRRVARALERVHAGNTAPVSGRLAQHFEQGGEMGRAVDAYRQAAHEAVALFSHAEALRLLDRALQLLERLPPSPERDRRELALQLAKVIPARSLGGYTAPALEAAAQRAAALGERLGDLAGLYHALRSLQTTRFVNGQLAMALELSERLQALSRDVPDRRAEGDHAMAGSLLTVGDLEGAIAHFERAESGYDAVIARAQLPVFGADLAVFTAAWQTHALWLAGYYDRAAVSSARAVHLAEALGHPYSRALAHAYAAAFHHMRRDRRACYSNARAATDICERHGFAYYVYWGRLFQAWADRAAPPAVCAAQVREAIEGLEREGAAVRRPFYLSVLASILARAGCVADARASLVEAEERARATHEHWWTPEVARLQGLLTPDRDARVACLRSAVSRAAELKSRPLAARAAFSLAATLRALGRVAEARASLASVLSASTPHADDRDRRRAERLLAHLSR